MQKLTEKTFRELKGLVLVDFNATWCGPCRMLHPVLEQLEEENKDVFFGEVDVDDDGDLAQALNISSIPCVIVFKDGKEVARSVGFKPKAQIQAFINTCK